MSHTPVSASEFEVRALEYVRLVDTSGEDRIVTDHGKPTPEIRPNQARDTRPSDILRDSVKRYDTSLDPIADDDCEVSRRSCSIRMGQPEAHRPSAHCVSAIHPIKSPTTDHARCTALTGTALTHYPSERQQ